MTEFERSVRPCDITDDPAVEPANAAVFFFMGFFALLVTYERSPARHEILEQNLTVMPPAGASMKPTHQAALDARPRLPRRPTMMTVLYEILRLAIGVGDLRARRVLLVLHRWSHLGTF